MTSLFSNLILILHATHSPSRKTILISTLVQQKCILAQDSGDTWDEASTKGLQVPKKARQNSQELLALLRNTHGRTYSQ